MIRVRFLRRYLWKLLKRTYLLVPKLTAKKKISGGFNGPPPNFLSISVFVSERVTFISKKKSSL